MKLNLILKTALPFVVCIALPFSASAYKDTTECSTASGIALTGPLGAGSFDSLIFNKATQAKALSIKSVKIDLSSVISIGKAKKGDPANCESQAQPYVQSMTVKIKGSVIKDSFICQDIYACE